MIFRFCGGYRFHYSHRDGDSVTFLCKCTMNFLLSTLLFTVPFLQFSRGSRLVLLDVDNTLYRERDTGIESQIVHGTHSYCKDVVGITKEIADQLYKEFGSTVEGLERSTWKELSKSELQEKLDEFYRVVYENVDVSPILIPDLDSTDGSTGYSHASKEEQKLARQLLKFSPHSIAFASNSPSWHVANVLRALGLEKLSKKCSTFTPDRMPMYPTKNRPKDFFSIDGDFNKYESISFLDDSFFNLKRVKDAFPLLVDRVHHINRVNEVKEDRKNDIDVGEGNLVQALLQDFGLTEPTFHLSQTRYLESKNKVDRRSLNAGIWNKVVKELKNKMLDESCESQNGPTSTQKDLWIVDLGAGLLSMLDLLLHGDNGLGLSALISSSDLSSIDTTNRILHYTAYESNQELYESSHERLLSWGFTVVERKGSNKNRAIDIIDYQKKQDGIDLRVKLVLRSFANVSRNELIGIPEQKVPNLIIGCCFADLMDPERLVPDLLRCFGLLRTSFSQLTGTMIYFPITFTGTTQFLPPQPFEFKTNGKTVPSDTVAFQSYSRALETVLGHNLNQYILEDVMEDHGAKLTDFGRSDWKISPERDTYLYATMLYFFGSTGGPQLLKEGWDAAGWIERARSNQPNIQVSNQDLLFYIEPGNKINDDEKSRIQSSKNNRIAEIMFTAPSKVTSVERNFPSQLGPKQVLGKSNISLSVH